MTEDIHNKKHTHYSGEVKLEDYYFPTYMSDIADRIAQDQKFDVACRKQIQKQNNDKEFATHAEQTFEDLINSISIASDGLGKLKDSIQETEDLVSRYRKNYSDYI